MEFFSIEMSEEFFSAKSQIHALLKERAANAKAVRQCLTTKKPDSTNKYEIKFVPRPRR